MNNIKVNSRVIVRSNEDDPLLIGKVIGFENFGKPNNPNLPIVKCEKTDKEFICMGIVNLYSNELMVKLAPLTPKEQWNLLAKNYKRK